MQLYTVFVGISKVALKCDNLFHIHIPNDIYTQIYACAILNKAQCLQKGKPAVFSFGLLVYCVLHS